MFRDRWECGHIGTVIFAVQAVLLVPYIIIAVMGGGTTLRAVSGGAGAVLARRRHRVARRDGLRVLRRHARHGLGQRVSDRAVPARSARSPSSVDRRRHGRVPAGDGVAARVAGDGAAADARARVAAVFLQLHVHPAVVDRLSAHRHLLPDGAAPRALPARPSCSIRSACWRSGCRRSSSASSPTARTDVPAIEAKLEARATLAAAGPDADARATRSAPRRRRRRRRDPAARRGLCAAVAGGAARRGGDGRGDGERLADPRAVDDVHRGRVRVLRRRDALRRRAAGADRPAVRRRAVTVVAYVIALRVPQSIFDLATQYAFAGYSALSPLLVAALFWRGSTQVGRARGHRLDGGGGARGRGRCRRSCRRRRRARPCRSCRSAASTSSPAPRPGRWCSACCRSCR